MIIKSKETTAAVEFVSKNENRIKDFEAKVIFAENNEVIIRTKYCIKNISNILAVQILILDGERTKVMIVAKPYSMRREKNIIKYNCRYKQSIGAEKYMNIHKPKHRKKKEGDDDGNTDNTADKGNVD